MRRCLERWERALRGAALQRARLASTDGFQHFGSILLVYSVGSARRDLQGKGQRQNTCFSCCLSHPCWSAGAVRCLAKSKEPPLRREAPSQQKFLPGCHTVPGDKWVEVRVRSLSMWKKGVWIFFCKEVIREILASEMGVRRGMK